jgi:tetratricopeptide (TPR) repeat protein
VIPDPFSALNGSLVRDDILNQKEDLPIRKIGDDYIVVTGPSRIANTDACRQAIIRFLIDPIIERHLKPALEFKEQITKLVAGVPTAAKEFGPSVYLVIRESLARAAEARMRRIQGMENGPAYGEDDAVFDLAQAYLRGAVLSFHFYDSLIGLEKVGISIEDFIDQMVATTKFDREVERPKEFEPVVTRVSAARRATPVAPPPSPEEVLAIKIITSNELIAQRRFAEARRALEDALAIAPDNARALFGLAQVVNQTPSPVEADPKSDENDKIQAQHERLEQALKLYRKVIDKASPQREAWLIQWSHVLAGRILDFQDFRVDALAEYEKAAALGDIPNGAYKEALQGKQAPYRRR